METVVRNPHEPHSAAQGQEYSLGGSLSMVIGGIAAIVLTIIGLGNVSPHWMLTIATIVLGAVLLFEGWFVAAEYQRLLRSTGPTASVEVGGGLGIEALAGIAAIVLGILALLEIVPVVLEPVAAIVLGAGLILGSGVMAQLNGLKIDVSTEHETAKRIAKDATGAATMVQILVGLAAVVLGILALLGFAPQTLELVAMLAIASSFLLSGSSLSGRTIFA
jgi:hypothetical protein